MLGCLLPWEMVAVVVKEVAKHITTSNQEGGIHKALEYFGVLSSEKVFVSRDYHFNKVKAFHHLMDERTQEEPKVWDVKGATHRAAFKVEELVEFVRAASNSEEEFQQAVQDLHQALDKAAEKVSKSTPAEKTLVGQVDALIDTLYFTYGSFVLMGGRPRAKSLKLSIKQTWVKSSQMVKLILIQ